MTELPAHVPSPPDRPYRLGEGARDVAAAEPLRQQVPTMELAAASRPYIAAEEAPSLSPVSAYAAPAGDGHAGFMSGRGLY
jgi:hypothetical protein